MLTLLKRSHIRLAVCAFFALTVLAVLLGPAAMAEPEPQTGTEIPTVLFTNAANDTPDLYVRKTVSSAVAGYDVPDTTFQFTIKVDDAFYGNELYRLFDSEGNEVFKYTEVAGSQVKEEYRTDGNGGFTLKAGQMALFPFVGVGRTYEVSETLPDGSSFVQSRPESGASAMGVVEPKGSTAEFENVYIPSTTPGGGDPVVETTVLHVSKTTSFPEDFMPPETTTFTFELKVDGTLYTNKTFELSSTLDGVVEGTSETDENGRFTLKGGQTATFRDIPVGVDYEVQELLDVAADGPDSPSDLGWRLTSSTNHYGETKLPLTVASFNNAIASFAVSKRLNDYSAPDGVSFNFFLTGEDGSGMGDELFYLYDADKKLVSPDAKKTGPDGSFSIAPNQTAVFVGIAPGTMYSVREQSSKGFIQTLPAAADGYVNQTVREDAVPTWPFENTPTVATGTLAVKKTVVSSNEADFEKEFTFTVELDDPDYNGEHGEFKFTDGVAEVKLKHGETKYAEGLPAGLAYTVTEKEANKNSFQTTVSDEKGTIPEDNTVTAAFVNEYTAKVLPSTGGPGAAAILAASAALCVFGAAIILTAVRHGAKKRPGRP